MISFILNDQDIETDLPEGMTVLDFARYRQDLKGTKIGCREGDCGACTILVGELVGDAVRYRTMTSCLMPLANAAGKHIVTIEGINPQDGSLTPVQQAMVDESGTQCGFCTVGFVMSLTGFCIDNDGSRINSGSTEAAISAIDGNICRCTGYKSIERAAYALCSQLADDGLQPDAEARTSGRAKTATFVPKYFSGISKRLAPIVKRMPKAEKYSVASVPFVAGGTDVYVQKPDAMAESKAAHLFYDEKIRGIRDTGEYIEICGSATVTDLLESRVMQSAFPDLYKHLKLVSSTPIRNMATLAGNFVNASPIGDMTVWFLALNAEIVLNSPPVLGGVAAASADGVVPSGENARTMLLKQLYLGYKQLARSPEEYITAIRFKKPTPDHYFNFEKVCKRTYLDIAAANTAMLLKCETIPGKSWVPPVLSGTKESSPYEGGLGFSTPSVLGEVGFSSPPFLGGVAAASGDGVVGGGSEGRIEHIILDAHVSAGGVAPVPLYLKETSSFLVGRTINPETISKANEIMQLEISPISDVRGTEAYKRLLLRQLFRAHFVELFGKGI